MKILSVSDIVEPMLDQQRGSGQFADIDLILSCGDLPPEYLSRLLDAIEAGEVQAGSNEYCQRLENVRGAALRQLGLVLVSFRRE